MLTTLTIISMAYCGVAIVLIVLGRKIGFHPWTMDRSHSDRTAGGLSHRGAAERTSQMVRVHRHVIHLCSGAHVWIIQIRRGKRPFRQISVSVQGVRSLWIISTDYHVECSLVAAGVFLLRAPASDRSDSLARCESPFARLACTG